MTEWIAEPIEVCWRGGIYLPELELWLDPPHASARAFISHAHADHVATHTRCYCSAITHQLMLKRFGKYAGTEFVELDEPQRIGDWELRALPAGHIIGSAMLHIRNVLDGRSLLYTGDFKLRKGLTAEPAQLLPADVLIMEATFGLPQFQFPPQEQVVQQLQRWVTEVIEGNEVPVLLGYSLGKAQEILALLEPLPYPVMLHESVFKMTQVVADKLPRLPEWKLFQASSARGHVLIFPPTAAQSRALKKLRICRTAMLSGWAMTAGARYRYQVDEVFPLSDHADYPDLIRTVQTVQPKVTYLVHGSVRELAADLRRRGWNAWALGCTDQLELDVLPEASSTTLHQSLDNPALVMESTPSEPHSFSRWVHTCQSTAEVPGRNAKLAILSDYLRALDTGSLPLGARFLSGQLFDPVLDPAPLQAGWAVIRRALQEVARCSEAEYRLAARSQNDTGRTAQVLLQMAPDLPQRCQLNLQECADELMTLRSLSGAFAKSACLAEQLRRRNAVEGAWWVRLLTGELRMGSREGLLEEAVALAFEQDAEHMREAIMLLGDVGRAAQLAQAARLDEVTPTPMVPLKVMLASPAADGIEVWQRLQTEGSVWLEDKFDGIRAQLHLTPPRVEVFSRDQKSIGHWFPELVGNLSQLSESCILDGEIVAYAEDKKLTFFDLQKRLGRRDQQDLFLPSAIQIRYYAFDLLYWQGRSLLKSPLQKRRQLLEEVIAAWQVPTLQAVPITRVDSPEQIEAEFLAARRRGNEGLMAKDPASIYGPGRRGKAWLKLKKAFATLDVVVVKVEQGHGKRSHVLSDYTFAVRDTRTDELKVIGKAYSGLTDVEIEQLTEHFRTQTIKEKGRARWVVPDIVLEIAFDSIQPSARHNSGLALRFPRIHAIRHDKTLQEIDTLEHAQKLAGLS